MVIATATAGVIAMINAMVAVATAMALRWWRLWQCWCGGRGSTTARAQEAVTAVAEEADDGRDRQQLSDFFLIVPTTNTECRGNGVWSLAARHIQGLSS